MFTHTHSLDVWAQNSKSPPKHWIIIIQSEPSNMITSFAIVVSAKLHIYRLNCLSNMHHYFSKGPLAECLSHLNKAIMEGCHVLQYLSKFYQLWGRSKQLWLTLMWIKSRKQPLIDWQSAGWCNVNCNIDLCMSACPHVMLAGPCRAYYIICICVYVFVFVYLEQSTVH